MRLRWKENAKMRKRRRNTEKNAMNPTRFYSMPIPILWIQHPRSRIRKVRAG